MVAGSNPVRSIILKEGNKGVSQETMSVGVDVAKHILVPEHSKLTDEEAKASLDKFNISKRQLPRIHKTDPAIRDLNPEQGDVIKIVRKSATAGKSIYFRVVING